MHNVVHYARYNVLWLIHPLQDQMFFNICKNDSHSHFCVRYGQSSVAAILNEADFKSFSVVGVLCTSIDYIMSFIKICSVNYDLFYLCINLF